ncbi:amidohydrolase family protein [Quadrisphaera setariae]|uniref:Amidohydrolase family protein n=1 Tax=Quadrisphaera setariae TaxID=2593304 RepID=A0A5C8ZHK0_9ACTN|nr:amidohydrolase family protein [Quadrisphaera setariae]TXR56396.1 amidohydrolase family protein [Quadrisphaera setariae]
MRPAEHQPGQGRGSAAPSAPPPSVDPTGWGALARRGGRRALRTASALRARARLAAVPLGRYAPRSALRVPEQRVERAACPAVDAHNHLGLWLNDGARWMAPDVRALLASMDATGVEAVVNLDGRWGAELEANLDRYDRAHPGRFATFCHVDLAAALAEPARAGARLVAQLEAGAAAGAAGLKVWKDLGLSLRDGSGARVLPDDERLAPLWERAGQLGLPVLVHVADPVAFFDPVDRHNERLEELLAHPDWALHGTGAPSHARLLRALDALVGAHSGTRFIAAHLASSAEDLAAASALLDAHPNLAVDLSGRLAELGRQPRAAARLLRRHAGRVLWGSDSFGFDVEEVRTWFRLLETDDEHFPYSPAPVPPQGRWAVSGLDLRAADEQALRAAYAGAARAWVPALGR